MALLVWCFGGRPGLCPAGGRDLTIFPRESEWIMPEVYKITRGSGAAGFMNPPGDPAHVYSVESYSSNRSNARMTGSMGLETAADESNTWVPAPIRERARKILAGADRIPSELWVRSVYGYFRNSWTADGAPWKSTEGLVFGARPAGAPDEWHAAVVHIRKWFPDHEPRADLIADPGKGYGSFPCAKCGERVQYEARLDALAVVSTRMSGSGITQWSYNAECASGGAHGHASAATGSRSAGFRTDG